VPADYHQPLIMPNESINVSKVCYDDLNFVETNNQPKEELKLPIKVMEKEGKQEQEEGNNPI